MCAAKIIQTVASFRILKKKHLFLNFQLYMCVGEGWEIVYFQQLVSVEN